MQSKRRFLVTGASGFIGRHAVSELLDLGHDVIALAQSAGRVDERVSQLHADLARETDFGSVVRAAGADTLLHFAWETRHGYYWDAPENLDWLAASVRLIKTFHEMGGRRAVVLGTCAEYRAPANGFCHELQTPAAPHHLYSASKDSLRRIIEVYARKTGLSFAWPRVFHLTGPGEFESRLIPAAIRTLSEGRIFETKNATKRLDVMDVRDCGRAIAMIGVSDIQGPINVGSGTPITIAEIVQELAGLLGRSNLTVACSTSGEPDDFPDRFAEVATLRGALAFEPLYTLRESLLAAIASSPYSAKKQDSQ